MKWLMNIGDPKAPYRPVYCAPWQTQAQAIAEEDAWLVGKIIGDPRASESYTVEELKAMGMVGVYEAEGEN